MTAQLLASELANLIQESKRKNSDLRQVRTVRFNTASLPGSRHAVADNANNRLPKSLWRSSKA